MRIYKLQDHSRFNDMSVDFIDSFSPITESDEKNKPNYKEIQKKVISDLNLNLSFVGTFGVGLSAFYPIVDKLINNAQVNIDMTAEKVVLLTIAAVSIVYLEEKKTKMSEKKEESLRKDCKSMLEELKMSGIGNGIVKKMVNAFKSIKNIFSLIGKHVGAIVGGFMDMFAYTSLFIPILNGILFVVGKYDLNLDTISQNFMGLAMGVGTLIAKHGIAEIINRLKGKFKINKKDIAGEIETPIIQKIGDMSIDDGETDKPKGELINEEI